MLIELYGNCLGAWHQNKTSNSPLKVGGEVAGYGLCFIVGT